MNKHFESLVLFRNVITRAINEIMQAPLETDDGLYDQKPFYKVKIAFIHPL